jgi:hypothetical protein
LLSLQPEPDLDLTRTDHVVSGSGIHHLCLLSRR